MPRQSTTARQAQLAPYNEGHRHCGDAPTNKGTDQGGPIRYPTQGLEAAHSKHPPPEAELSKFSPTRTSPPPPGHHWPTLLYDNTRTMAMPSNGIASPSTGGHSLPATDQHARHSTMLPSIQDDSTAALRGGGGMIPLSNSDGAHCPQDSTKPAGQTPLRLRRATKKIS